MFEPVRQETLIQEQDLEEWLAQNPDILFEGEHILWIDREKPLQQKPDLLGIDSEANTVIIELKKDRLARDVIAQALDYASQIALLRYEELNQLALQFFKEAGLSYASLLEAYQDHFTEGLADQEEDATVPQFNQSQRIVIVGQRIDEAVLRTARYLRERGIDISCIEFTYYKTEKGEELLEMDVAIGREDVKPPSGKPKPPDYSDFLERVRGKVLADLRESFQPARVTKRPTRVLAFGISNVCNLRFDVRVDEGSYCVRFSMLPRKVGNEAEVAEQVYRFLWEHKRIIEGQLGELIWDDTKPIRRFIQDRVSQWTCSREELAERLAPSVAERLRLFIKVILPILEEGRKKGQIDW